MQITDPRNVITPGAQVADASLRIIDDLQVLQLREGEAAMLVEAMAMHNASLAVLRPSIGTAGVRQMIALAGAENDAAGARDDANRAERDLCRAAQAKKTKRRAGQ